MAKLSTLHKTLTSICVVAAIGSTSLQPGHAKTPLDLANAGYWFDEGMTSPYHHYHLLRPLCTAGYPMHHLSACETATGGPSGGIN